MLRGIPSWNLCQKHVWIHASFIHRKGSGDVATHVSKAIGIYIKYTQLLCFQEATCLSVYLLSCILRKVWQASNLLFCENSMCRQLSKKPTECSCGPPWAQVWGAAIGGRDACKLSLPLIGIFVEKTLCLLCHVQKSPQVRQLRPDTSWLFR